MCQRLCPQPLPVPGHLRPQAGLSTRLHLRVSPGSLWSLLRAQVSDNEGQGVPVGPRPSCWAAMQGTRVGRDSRVAVAVSPCVTPCGVPNRESQPCPRGWWGHPTCGPCSCDVTKGFDPDCNKTTGECHCKVGPCPCPHLCPVSPGSGDSPKSCHPPRRTTTGRRAATPACCATATPPGPCPASAMSPAGSVPARPVSSAATATAVTTHLPR